MTTGKVQLLENVAIDVKDQLESQMAIRQCTTPMTSFFSHDHLSVCLCRRLSN